MVIKLRCYFVCFCLFIVCGFLSPQTQTECDKMIEQGVRAMNRQQYEKSLELLTKVKIQAQKNQWNKQLFLSVNNIGANYFLLLDYGEALNNYLDAYKIALQEANPTFEITVLNNIAILYAKDKKFDKAEEYLMKAYESADNQNNLIKKGLYAMNLASVYIETKNIVKCKKYLDIALPLLHDVPDLLLQAKIVQVQYYFSILSYTQARQASEVILPQLNKESNRENKGKVLYYLAEIYDSENKSNLAIYYAGQSIHLPGTNWEDKLDTYKLLSDIYAKKQEYVKALAYKDSVVLANNSFNEMKNGKLFENSLIKFELQNYQKELSVSQQKLKIERLAYYSIIAALLLLILVVMWAIHNRMIRLKQIKIISELELEKEKKDKLILEQKYKEQEALSLLEKERLHNELETKNRQLTTKALSISARNDSVEKLVNALLTESAVSQNDKLKNRIADIKNELQKDTDWDEFFSHFEEVNHHFLKTLRNEYPVLSSNDLRYLSYVYMNLSPKEISSLLSITIEACRKRKERILKKMELNEDIDLYACISAL